jgi:hypothetical protein
MVQQSNKNGVSEIVIIPGSETLKKASIVGVMEAKSGLKFASTDSIIAYYKSGLDEGSVLTVVDQSRDSTNLWALFKVETPKTAKYPEPESDLYYVAQGDYALFDMHVAIKQPSLSADFLKKWAPIFKESKLEKL